MSPADETRLRGYIAAARDAMRAVVAADARLYRACLADEPDAAHVEQIGNEQHAALVHATHACNTAWLARRELMRAGLRPEAAA